MSEFNKEKFSQYVMDRPHFGEIKESSPSHKLYKYALDKAGCGDSYEMTLLVGESGDIADAKYITFGCGYAQATCCALIDAMAGKNIKEISSWSEEKVGQEIENILGEFPIHKKAYLFFAKQLLDGTIQQMTPEHQEVSK